jgi:hypothetical protein
MHPRIGRNEIGTRKRFGIYRQLSFAFSSGRTTHAVFEAIRVRKDRAHDILLSLEGGWVGIDTRRENKGTVGLSERSDRHERTTCGEELCQYEISPDLAF